jgi:hypothetical protein
MALHARAGATADAGKPNSTAVGASDAVKSDSDDDFDRHIAASTQKRYSGESGDGTPQIAANMTKPEIVFAIADHFHQFHLNPIHD